MSVPRFHWKGMLDGKPLEFDYVNAADYDALRAVAERLFDASTKFKGQMALLCQRIAVLKLDKKILDEPFMNECESLGLYGHGETLGKALADAERFLQA